MHGHKNEDISTSPVRQKYGFTSVVVFDWYPSKKQKAVDVIFDGSMLVQVSQKQF